MDDPEADKPTADDVRVMIDALTDLYRERLKNEASAYFRWRSWQLQRQAAEVLRNRFAEMQHEWNETLQLDQVREHSWSLVDSVEVWGSRGPLSDE